MKYLISIILGTVLTGSAQAQLFSKSSPRYSMRNGVMMACQNGVCTKVSSYSQPTVVAQPTIVKEVIQPKQEPKVSKDCDCATCNCVTCNCVAKPSKPVAQSVAKPQKFIEEPKISVKVSSLSLDIVLK